LKEKGGRRPDVGTLAKGSSKHEKKRVTKADQN